MEGEALGDIELSLKDRKICFLLLFYEGREGGEAAILKLVRRAGRLAGLGDSKQASGINVMLMSARVSCERQRGLSLTQERRK